MGGSGKRRGSAVALDICHAWLPSSSSPPLSGVDRGVVGTCGAGTLEGNLDRRGQPEDAPCGLDGNEEILNILIGWFDSRGGGDCWHGD